jgi:hypothetical protein
MHFAGVSTSVGQDLLSAGGKFTVPFSWGFWTRPTATALSQSMGVSCTSSSVDIGFYCESDAATATTGVLGYWNGTSGGGFILITGAWAAGSWTYVICRVISATNRRFTILKPNGTITETQDVANVTYGTITRWSLGGFASSAAADDFTNGEVQEFWTSPTDIYPIGAIPTDMVRQLAYRGPWSIPHIAGTVEDYRSLRNGAASIDADPREIYSRTGTSGAWTYAGNNGLPTRSPVNPPLIEPYRRGPLILPRLIGA